VCRYFIGSTTQAYIVTLNSTSTYNIGMLARGAGLPFDDVYVNSSQQVSTNCSHTGDCEMELISPLVNTWHYLAVSNWMNDSLNVNLRVNTTGELLLLLLLLLYLALPGCCITWLLITGCYIYLLIIIVVITQSIYYCSCYHSFVLKLQLLLVYYYYSYTTATNDCNKNNV